MDDKTLGQASDSELIEELRNRGLVGTFFSKEDMETIITEDEDVAGLGLDDEAFGTLLETAFRECSWKLDDRLSERGNEYLAHMWAIEKDGVLAEVSQGLKADR